MSSIIVATLAVAVIGMLIGILLVTVDKKFKVEVDEKQVAIRECLPGNNCGGCGYAGCDALASAIANQEAPVNACPVGGDPCPQKRSAVCSVFRWKKQKKSPLMSNAPATAKMQQPDAVTSASTTALPLPAAGLSPWTCDYGCIGFGTCASACPFGAITVNQGVASVDRSKCKACGKCVAACPRHLIELVPESAVYAVRCSSHDRGAAVKKVCKAGCLACKLCEKQCESGAITVENNVAHIDYEKCTKCGKCAEKCPAGVIRKKDVS